jgi:hypothetical protein
MMLATFTWAPPSCSARLPQKFSAATTWMTVELPEEPVVAVLGVVEQPATASARATGTAATASQRRRRRRAVPGGRVEDTASLRQRGLLSRTR